MGVLTVRHVDPGDDPPVGLLDGEPRGYVVRHRREADRLTHPHRDGSACPGGGEARRDAECVGAIAREQPTLVEAPVGHSRPVGTDQAAGSCGVARAERRQRRLRVDERPGRAREGEPPLPAGDTFVAQRRCRALGRHRRRDSGGRVDLQIIRRRLEQVATRQAAIRTLPSLRTTETPPCENQPTGTLPRGHPLLAPLPAAHASRPWPTRSTMGSAAYLLPGRGVPGRGTSRCHPDVLTRSRFRPPPS